MSDEAFHYPPDVLDLLVDTVPLLVRGKRDVVLFFRACGVPRSLLADLETRVTNRDTISKYEIARTVLTRLNERGDSMLRQRREVIRRVVEFEDFSTCWPDDQLKAKGLVAEVSRIVGTKDAFTRMADERAREADHRREARQQLELEREERTKRRDDIRRRLFGLFALDDPKQRGALLERILNELFDHFGILVTEAFTRTGDEGEGIVEQVDGVVNLDGHLYLVEVKWKKEPLGVDDVSRHLVRTFTREQSRAIVISASGYTDPAISTCKDALARAVVVLCTLEEMVTALDGGGDVKEMLRSKVEAAILRRSPYEPYRPS